MRHCVLRHHVCLCVLSTAMLAGFALLTEQKKGYAQLLQDYCKPVANSGEKKWRIECDGNNNATGRVEDSRTIDMNGAGNINKPAVKVYKKGGKGVDIRITGDVTITGNGSSEPAIQVEKQGVLTVMNVTATGVKKGIEVLGPKSSVTVNRGKINLVSEGVSVIDVKGGGKVTLNEGVTVNGDRGATGVTGIVVGDGGGSVMVMTKNFTGVNKGIVFKGTGMANVSGGAERATMTVIAGGTGITMERMATGTANASVMNMTVKGQNSGTGVDMKNGMLTLMNVGISGFTTGMNMTGGMLTVMGSSRIEVTGSNGVGLSVMGMDATANVMGGIIMAQGGGGNGSGRVGVEMTGSRTVTLSGVTVSGFKTGISVTSGEVRVSGESKIIGTTMGVEVKGGKFVASMGGDGKIEVQAGGTGLKVTGAGIANVTGGKIKGKGGTGTGVEAGGKEVTLTGVEVSGFTTGVSVTNGKLTVSGESKIIGTTMGVSVTGSGKFVMGGAGGGSMIAVTEHNGVGLKVTEQGTANVMNSAITTSGSGVTGSGRIGVESSGTVTLNMVGVMGFDKGVSVSDGKLTVNGGSIIQGKSVGVEVKDGEFEMEGTESGIQVEGGTGVGLKVMGMGSASVMNSAIMASGSGIGQGTGVLMESSGTVTLNGVGISGFTTGISVTKGKFKMTRGSITGNGVTGKVGVYAASGTVTLEGGVEISGFTTGVDVESGTLTISGGKITGTGSGGSYGVQVANGGTLTDVTISSFVTGVSVTGGTLTVKGGSITGTGGSGSYGVHAMSGTVTLDGVVKISQVGAGVYMTKGTLTMTGGTEIELASGNGYGVYVGRDVKSASLKDVTIKGGGKGYGVYAASGTVTLEGVVKISQVEMGIVVSGGQLTIKKGTEISLASGGRYGVYVGRDVKSASLNDVKIIGGGLGSRYGVYARGEVVMISGGAIKEVEEGIVMLGKGTLTVKKGTEINLASDSKYGVYVGIEVTKATLTETVITGQNKGYGVYAEGKNVTLEGVGISNVKTGVEVMRGTLMINRVNGKNSTISFMGDGVGVKVGEKVTKADLDNVTITGNGSGGTGIHAMGEMMMISGGEISQVKTGVYTEKGRLTMTGGKMTNVQTGVYMTGGELTMNKGTTISLARKSEYGVYVGRNVTRADLNNVTITGGGSGSEYGVYVVGMGVVTMTGGTIKDVDKGVEVKGGTLTINGNSTISFVGEYGVGVKVGENVTVTNVGITGGGTRSTGVEVWGGKEVMLTNVGISNVGKGVSMMSGNSLTISGINGKNSTISFVGEYGVYVGGDVKSASLKDVTIKGESNNGYGVYAEGTGKNGALTMELTGVKISGVTMGVYAGGGTLTMNKGTTISFTEDGVGVYVEGDVTANLTGTVITGEEGRYGVYARGTMGKGEMTLTNVGIEGVMTGVVMMGGKSLTVERGTRIELADRGRYGVYVKNTAMAKLTGTVITGSRGGTGVYAVETTGNGALTMALALTGVDILDVTTGVVMLGGKSLTISGHSTINFVGSYGVGVKVGGDVTAKLIGTTITGERSGTGVYARGTMGKNGALTMMLDNVTIKGVEEGVKMRWGKSLTISGDSSVISFVGNGVGVIVGGEVKSANLKDVTIRGSKGGTGVYVEETGNGALTMALDNVRIEGVKTGVKMMGGKSLMIRGIHGKNSTINFAGDYGVYVKNTAMVELTGTRIVGQKSGSRYGVYAEEMTGNGELTMMLDNVRISGVKTGVKMMWGESLTVMGDSTINFMGDGVGVYVAGEVTKASLMETRIVGGGLGSTGVHAVGENVTLTLTDVEIEGVQMGITMKGGGTLMVEKGTEISLVGGGYGVMVGGDVTAKLTETVIKGGGSGKGVYARGAGYGELTVALDNVGISEVEMGVVMEKGGMLVISGDSTISVVGDYGVYVKNTAMVELTKTKIIGQNSGRGGNNGVKYGVYATGGDVTMMLTDVTIEEVKTGITMLGGGLKVSGGSITKVETGIAMSGSGTLMVEKETEIQFTKGYGVMVGERVTANLMGTTIKGEGKGSTGVYVAGGKALLEQVKIEGSNQATGLYVTQGAVRLKNTTLRDVAMGMTISQGVVMMEGGELEFTDRYGISVSGGQAVLSGFKIIKKGNKDTDKSTGVWVDNSGKVMMRGVDISGVQMGAYVMETGLLVMDKGSIDFKGEYGVYFKQGDGVFNGVNITGPGHKGTGIKMGGGKLLMVDTTLKNVAEGMTIIRGNVTMKGGSIEFGREYAILFKQGKALLTDVSMEYKGSDLGGTFLKVEADSVFDTQGKRILNTADIKGMGVKFDGKDKARGVYVTNGGRVMLKSAIFSNLMNGVEVLNGQTTSEAIFSR